MFLHCSFFLPHHLLFLPIRYKALKLLMFLTNLVYLLLCLYLRHLTLELFDLFGFSLLLNLSFELFDFFSCSLLILLFCKLALVCSLVSIHLYFQLNQLISKLLSL